MKLSTDKILSAAVAMVGIKHKIFPVAYLDIGSGTGELINLMRGKYTLASVSACDYTADLMKIDDIKVEVANLNTDKLPYANESFDIATCTEVVEHLEHYRETLQEVFRVLRGGGGAH